MTDPGAMLMDFQFHYICGIHLVTMTKIEVLHIKGKYSKRRKKMYFYFTIKTNTKDAITINRYQ
jgi:hypothetical protein